jgi:hypothetical protein
VFGRSFDVPVDSSESDKSGVTEFCDGDGFLMHGDGFFMPCAQGIFTGHMVCFGRRLFMPLRPLEL